MGKSVRVGGPKKGAKSRRKRRLRHKTSPHHPKPPGYEGTDTGTRTIVGRKEAKKANKKRGVGPAVRNTPSPEAMHKGISRGPCNAEGKTTATTGESHRTRRKGVGTLWEEVS